MPETIAVPELGLLREIYHPGKRHHKVTYTVLFHHSGTFQIKTAYLPLDTDWQGERACRLLEEAAAPGQKIEVLNVVVDPLESYDANGEIYCLACDNKGWIAESLPQLIGCFGIKACNSCGRYDDHKSAADDLRQQVESKLLVTVAYEFIGRFQRALDNARHALWLPFYLYSINARVNQSAVVSPMRLIPALNLTQALACLQAIIPIEEKNVTFVDRFGLFYDYKDLQENTRRGHKVSLFQDFRAKYETH